MLGGLRKTFIYGLARTKPQKVDTAIRRALKDKQVIQSFDPSFEPQREE